MPDKELEALRAAVDCREVLERAGWTLDRAGSTRRAPKYRDGPARIVVVTHGGRGWFDPLSDARGDVIALAQHLWGGTLGHARAALRPLAGRASRSAWPGEPAVAPTGRRDAGADWSAARLPAPGSPAWRYLSEARCLPPEVLARAAGAGLLREGVRGTAWALHNDADGRPCGWEMRGPAYKGFSKGGTKGLFRLGAPDARRWVVAESFVDALSVLALADGAGEGIAVASTGGGFGPAAARALRELVGPGSRLVAATDRGEGGELLAARLHRIAEEAGAGFGRLRPVLSDWNDDLRQRPR